MAKEKLILIDGNALVHRAFHALPPSLTDSQGRMVNGVYGFILVFLRVISEFKPDFVVATFDRKGKTFRHRRYSLYKAQRKKAPDELYMQIPLVKEVLKSFGIPIYSQKGLEADDLIGAIAKDFSKKKDREVVIVTGDSDTLQLVNPKVKVFALRKGTKDTVLYGEEEVFQKMELTPSQIVDFKALAGDSSDNIPGAKGIGQKTAVGLLQRFGDLENIYANLGELPVAVAKKLTDSRADVFLSQELAEIKTDFKTGFLVSTARFLGIEPRKAEILKIFKELAFFSLIKRLALDDSFPSPVPTETLIKPLFEFTEVTSLREKDFFIQELKKAVAAVFLIFPRPWFLKSKKDVFAFGGEFVFWAPLDSALVFKIKKEDFLSLFRIHKNKSLIGFEVKHDFKKLKGADSVLSPLKDDVKILGYLVLAGRGGVDLASLCKEKKISLPFWEASLNVPKKRQETLFSLVTKEEESEALEKENQLIAETVSAIRMLYLLLKEELKIITKEQKKEGISPIPYSKIKKGFWGLDLVYKNIEMPLVRVLAKMEERGIGIDLEKAKQLVKDYCLRSEKIKQKVFGLCQEEFNLDSPQQLSLIFYKKLKFSTQGIKKGKSGFYSTSVDALEILAERYPVAKMVKSYRELTKLINTYLEPLPELVNQKTGRVYAGFNQEVTTTGRLSSSNPNIQNIPTRTAAGKKIRGIFRAEEGFSLFSFDYSQIELRLAAHYSGDKTMRRVFLENGDIHKTTAAEVGGITEEKVTSKMRSAAKELNFGLIYGMGSYGFSRAAGISRSAGKEFIERYWQKFPAVASYLEEAKKVAQKNGFVETLFGRRRSIPETRSPNWQVRASAERMAVNMPLQGTAADILKLAMVRIDCFLGEKGLEDEFKMLASVHDEILFEVKKGTKEKIILEVKRIMEQVVELAVPLKVDVKSGENWEEMESCVWAGRDLNPRRRKPADLQSGAFDHSATDPTFGL